MNLEIRFKSEHKEFYFNVKERVSKIMGDSGIGKTFFFSKLADEIEASRKGFTSYPVQDTDIKERVDTLVLNVEEFDKEEEIYNKIVTFNGDLIVLDEADMLLHSSKRIVDFINKSDKYFIIVSRSWIPGLHLNLSDYAKVLDDGLNIAIEYR